MSVGGSKVNVYMYQHIQDNRSFSADESVSGMTSVVHQQGWFNVQPKTVYFKGFTKSCENITGRRRLVSL